MADTPSQSDALSLPMTTTTPIVGVGAWSRTSLLESMVRERDEIIRELEGTAAANQLSLLEARDELHRIRVQRREDAHWKRVRESREAAEKKDIEARVCGLERALAERQLPRSGGASNNDDVLDRAYVTKLQAHLARSLRIVADLDRKVSSVESGAAEAAITARTELKEALEERSRTELDLLNQMAKLDADRRRSEEDLRNRLRQSQAELEAMRTELACVRSERDTLLSQQQPQNFSLEATHLVTPDLNTTHQCDETGIDDLSAYPAENGIDHEQDDDASNPNSPSRSKKGDMEDGDHKENDNDDAAVWKDRLLQMEQETEARLRDLEESHHLKIASLEATVVSLKDFHAFETDRVVNLVRSLSDEAQSGLEEAATLTTSLDRIWNEHIDPAVRVLGGIRGNGISHKKCDASPETNVDTDVIDLVEDALDHAKLLHGQIKLSLRSAEACLRNQADAVAPLISSGENGDSAWRVLPEYARRVLLPRRDATAAQKVRYVRDAALQRLRRIEEDATQRIALLAEDQQGRDDAAAQTLALWQTRATELESTLEGLRKSNDELSASSQQKSPSLRRKNAFVSAEVLEQLRTEVYAAVDRMRAKDDTIVRLTAAVEEGAVREAAIRKEVLRLSKRVRTLEGDDLLADLEASRWSCGEPSRSYSLRSISSSSSSLNFSVGGIGNGEGEGNGILHTKSGLSSLGSPSLSTP